MKHNLAIIAILASFIFLPIACAGGDDVHKFQDGDVTCYVKMNALSCVRTQ